MTELNIEYLDNQFISLDITDGLLFVGGNQELKWQILRTFKRLDKGKSLNELEQKIYGENGIEVYLDNHLINKKTHDFYILDSSDAIYQLFSYSKGSLLYQHLSLLKDNFDVDQFIYQINEKYLELENYLNREMIKDSDNTSLVLKDLSLDSILKNQLSLRYSIDNDEFPLEFIDAELLIDEFIHFLKLQLLMTKRPTWVILNNLNSFLNKEQQQYLMSHLKQLHQETKLLYFLIFSNSDFLLDITEEDLSRIVILYSEVQQMPEFPIFKESISRHYPDKFSWSDQELVNSFARVVNYIGKNVDMTCFSARDMVLLKVLKGVLSDETSITYQLNSLTELERKFLND